MKNIVIGVLIAALLLCGFFLYRNAKAGSDQITFLKQELKTYQDKEGKLLAEINVLELSNKEAKAALADVQKELESSTGQKIVYIRDHTKITTATADDISLEPFVIDEEDIEGEYEFVEVEKEVIPDGWRYKDNWGEFTIRKEKDIFWDTYYLDYTVKDEITFTTVEKGNGVFSPKSVSLLGTSSNPNTIITGIEAIEVRPKPQRFSAGIQSGLGIGSDGKVRPFLGVGVQYALIYF